MPKKANVAGAPPVRLRAACGWTVCDSADAFVSVHDRCGDNDGIVYLGNRFNVRETGRWLIHLGHDGGARLFVDGRPVYCEPKRVNPAATDRARIPVKLAKGAHEIVVALDTDRGLGWGIYFCFELAAASRKPGVPPYFPQAV
jgi:hypothetical protein